MLFIFKPYLTIFSLQCFFLIFWFLSCREKTAFKQRKKTCLDMPLLIYWSVSFILLAFLLLNPLSYLAKHWVTLNTFNMAGSKSRKEERKREKIYWWKSFVKWEIKVANKMSGFQNEDNSSKIIRSVNVMLLYLLCFLYLNLVLSLNACKLFCLISWYYKKETKQNVDCFSSFIWRIWRFHLPAFILTTWGNLEENFL